MQEAGESIQLKQNNVFIKNTYKKALLPCMLSILSANINVIVDGILVGQKLGTNALAAINLCMPINLFLCVIGSFISSGVAINSSKALGAQAVKKANEYYKLGIILAYIFSVIVTFSGVIFINDICRFLCSDSGAFPYVRAYTLVTLIGAIFKVMIYIPFWYLRLDGQNKEISFMMSVMTIGNIILDVLFIFVFDYGVYGASAANVIATAVALLMGIHYLKQNKSDFKFSLKFDKKYISLKRIIADGIPSSLNNLCSTIRILMINSILLAFGGVSLVAVFTAVMGVFSIGECIILGVPQASNAMLGVYAGERDNQSCKFILKSELLMGAIYSALFFILCMIVSPLVGRIYSINSSMFIPLLFMSLSIYPALVCHALSSYYNISGKNTISVVIIFLRLVVFTYVGLILSNIINISPFSFYLFAEIMTLVFIYIFTGVYFARNKNVDRFLMYNNKDDYSGKILNFSVENDHENICKSSELISDFCSENGLSIKDTMKIQLAIEEALILISDVNKNEKSDLDGFDIRAFIYDDLSGIRIRYDGLDFNPFAGQMNTSDYMGVKMIADMLESTIYQRTFGVNTLILLLKGQNIG